MAPDDANHVPACGELVLGDFSMVSAPFLANWTSRIMPSRTLCGSENDLDEGSCEPLVRCRIRHSVIRACPPGLFEHRHAERGWRSRRISGRQPPTIDRRSQRGEQQRWRGRGGNRSGNGRQPRCIGRERNRQRKGLQQPRCGGQRNRLGPERRLPVRASPTTTSRTEAKSISARRWVG